MKKGSKAIKKDKNADLGNGMDIDDYEDDAFAGFFNPSDVTGDDATTIGRNKKKGRSSKETAAGKKKTNVGDEEADDFGALYGVAEYVPDDLANAKPSKSRPKKKNTRGGWLWGRKAVEDAEDANRVCGSAEGLDLDDYMDNDVYSGV